MLANQYVQAAGDVAGAVYFVVKKDDVASAIKCLVSAATDLQLTNVLTFLNQMAAIVSLSTPAAKTA